LSGPVEEAKRLAEKLGLRARVRGLGERDLEELARLLWGRSDEGAVEAVRALLYSQPFSMVVYDRESPEIILGPRSTLFDARRGVAKALVLERAGPVEAECREPAGERLLCALASVVTDVAADAVGASLFGEEYRREAAARMLDAAEKAREALAAGHDNPLLRLAAAAAQAYTSPPPPLKEAMEELAREPTPEALARLANTLLALAGLADIVAVARGDRVLLERLPRGPAREGAA